MTEFDPQEHGLESHYAPEQQARIRRLMLEDWKEAGVKLPTYMKLVARFIEKTGIPEEYLSKLSHQTMSKMLKRTSTPRYEFWAALHLYLSKKYGVVEIDSTFSEEDMLGASLVRYWGAQSAPQAHQYEVDGVAIEIVPVEGKDYSAAQVITPAKDTSEFTLNIEQLIKGVAIEQEHKIITTMRDTMTREGFTWEIEL
jgi:hypothetical protein